MEFNDISNEDEATNDYSSYWQSIPDPPTPTPAGLPEKLTADCGEGAAPRRRRRRESLAPLKDLTNQDFMLESGVDSGKPLKVMKMEDKKPSALPDAATSSYFSDLDDSDDIGLICSKKSNKRRSLILPSHAGQIFAEVGEVSKSAAVSSIETEAQAPVNHSDDPSFTNETLVQLVRKYCSLPTDQRVNSRESKAIESISGYPLPGKVHDIYDPETDTCKREFVLKAQPVIQMMEQQKQKDIDDAQSYTQCEVRKNPRGGFQYVDVNTLELVSSEEYRLRYSAMINDRREQRKRVAVGTLSEEKDEPSIGEKASPFAEDSNMDMSAMSIDDSLVNADDDNIVVSYKRASSIPSKISTVAKQESSQHLANITKFEASDSTKSAHTNIKNSDPSLPALAAQSKTTSQNLLAAAMPSSDDPRVIAVRKTLFQAIDMALAEYSREILALQDEKNNG